MTTGFSGISVHLSLHVLFPHLPTQITPNKKHLSILIKHFNFAWRAHTFSELLCWQKKKSTGHGWQQTTSTFNGPHQNRSQKSGLTRTINRTGEQSRDGHRQTALIQTSSCCKRRTETQRHSSTDCHIVQLPPDWKLSWHWRSLCFHHLTISLLSGDKSEALWLRRHRTAGLSAHVASLLSVHMYSSLPRKGPLLWEQKCWE